MKLCMYGQWMPTYLYYVGARFITLFIVCLILFAMTMLLNIMIVFSKVLVKYKCINKLKPLLDAYQNPYKSKFYYWIGLQLVITALLFGISSLNGSIKLTVTIIILSIINTLHGLCRPFKNKAKNYQELLLIMNLLVLHVLVLSGLGPTSTVVTTMIAIAILQFMSTIAYHIVFYLCNGVVHQSICKWISWLKRTMIGQTVRHK